MPRLLPRLLASLADSQARDIPILYGGISRPPKIRSRFRPHVPVESDTFSSEGKSRSILLNAPEAIQPPRRRKRQPPWPRLAPNQRNSAISGSSTDKDDPPRLMNEQERRWWSSPYLRMLSTPIREDKVTRRLLPSAFLIRLVALRLPAPRVASSTRPSTAHPGNILVPDGILHPRYIKSRSSAGLHIIARRDALEKSTRRPFLKHIPFLRRVHPSLIAHISHHLRLRILQEAEVLANDLICQPRGASDSPLIRRLTRAEFAALKAGEPIADDGAVAIIVVPPINRDPVTKTRPTPTSALALSPPEANTSSEKPPRLSLPLSTMHAIVSSSGTSGQGNNHKPSEFSIQSGPRAPLYNGVTLFPHRVQRAALHQALTKLLHVERQARWRSQTSDHTPAEEEAKPKDKGSHAFLLRSDAKTVRRSDTVPLAIALWRLRLWEGESWGKLTKERWDVVL